MFVIATIYLAQTTFYYAADICMLCYKPDCPQSLETVRRLWNECPELHDPRVFLTCLRI